MVIMMFVGGVCCCLTDYSYYSDSRKSMGREFFVPARTLIGVKLITNENCSHASVEGAPKVSGHVSIS